MSNEKNNGIISILKFGVKPLSIFVTAIFTLTFGVIGSFTTPNTTLNTICDKGFYISLSIIILQTLFQNFLLKEGTDLLNKTVDELHKKIKSTECVVFPEKRYFINSKIGDLLNSHKIRKMKIICYGTSKFGRIIDSIITTHKTVQVEVIVCSPDQSFFDLKSDKQLLKNVIEELVLAKNIKIFISEIPPTIRASVMYEENEKPVWCSMQAYYIFPHDEYKLFKGEGFSPSIIADTENEIMLMHLTEIFDFEFERLQQKSQEITTKIIKKRKEDQTW